MKSTPKLLVLALFAVGSLLAADPYVGYIYPAGIQVGTTNRLIVCGQALNGVKAVHLTGTGLHVLKTELVPGFPNANGTQRRYLTRWLNAIAEGKKEKPAIPPNSHEEEWRKNSWWERLDTLDPLQLSLVERNLFTPRNPLQASPSLRQLLLVTVAADADAKPGRHSLVLDTGKGLSAPRPVLVSGVRRIAEPMYVPPMRTQPPTPQVDLRQGAAILDGQIMPGETDSFSLQLAANRPYTFAVTARELQPYIGDAVPGFFNAIITLKNAQGEVVAVADDTQRFRPDPVLHFTPSANGEYRLEIHDVLYRGRGDFVYSVRITADGAKVHHPPRKPQGIVKRGKAASHTFTVDQPGKRVFEVFARRRGSPLDAVLTLRKVAGGPILAQWDDVTNKVFVGTIPQAECDPIGEYEFKESGEYVAEVSDRTGNGGPDYAWWLDIREPRPSFAVYSTRSTLPLMRGVPLKVGFQVIRKDGFQGDITIETPLSIHPANNVITNGANQVTASLTYVGRPPVPFTATKLFASAMIDGRKVTVPVVPCDEYEQAFAWKHLVPAEKFWMRCFGGAPRRR